MSAKHTPGPWQTSLSDDTFIRGADGGDVCKMLGVYEDDAVWPVMEANAALIVRAVNAHADLLETLEKIASAPAWGYPDRWQTTPAEVRLLARAAIAKATGA